MLTTQAFNALLKTLEEPPGHVKFIFCTTDPDKIPITVLSRCQRYDFPPVHTDQILTRLKFICTNEGTQADEDALKLIARRASGSMRDSQSLLEQMLSFGGKHITVDEVHAMLGTADESRLALFAECMVRRDAARAITELNSAIADGVDPGQLAEQFLGYLRDVMTVAIGAPAELVRTADPSNVSDLKAYGNAWGLSTLLSAIQLLDESIVKMKHSVQSRILLEVALVQICTLADLQSIADIAQGIALNLNPSAGPKRAELPSVQAPSEKKNSEQAPAAIAPAATEPTEGGEVVESSDVKKKEPQNLDPSQETPEVAEPRQQLAVVALELEGLARQLASLALEVVEHPEGRWKVRLAKEAEWTFSKFTSPENLRKLTEGLMRLTGRQIELDFVVTDEPMPQQQGVRDQEPKPTQGVSQPQRIREMMATDLIKRFIDVLGGEVVKVED
jgi:DNA polymerase-3 subunit gamma/tau